MTDDGGYRPTNREKSRAPKFGLFWCDGCDANLVGDNQRCRACGYIHNTQRESPGAR